MRKRKIKEIDLENRIQLSVQKLEGHEQNREYLDCKRGLNDIYDRYIEVIKKRQGKQYKEGKNHQR